MNYDQLVQEVIDLLRKSPVDMLGNGGGEAEVTYVNVLKDSYVRTVRDVDGLFPDAKNGRSVLEVGSFLGVVSIALKKIGYNVCAQDIPEFHQSAALCALYEQHAIPFRGLNLRKRELPYASASFDAVIMCEVLEHLNFNPLPVLLEINRILKDGGYLYLAMPNQSALFKRIKLLRGKSVHNPIDEFFTQLSQKGNMIVGLHWREYTLAETVHLLEKMGFTPVRQYYFLPGGRFPSNPLVATLRMLECAYPAFRPFQVVIGRKTSVPAHDFWFTDAST